MNARIDLPSDDNVVSLVDLLERRSADFGPRKTVAQLQTVPRSHVAPAPVRRRVSPSLSPIDLARRALRFGVITALVAGACTLGYALAAGTASEQIPWLVAFVSLMAFSFGASSGSISSFVAQRDLAVASLRASRSSRSQNGT